MAIANFDFYQNEYQGITITDSSEYAYFAERASDELAPFVNRVPKAEEAQKQLQRCACRIADIIYADYKSSKYGNGSPKITSESVSGYYSVTFGTQTSNDGISQVRHQISTAISLYIGRYIFKSLRVTL